MPAIVTNDIRFNGSDNFIASVKNGGGCYNPYEDYYKDKDSNEYELYIPLLNTRSSIAIYLKIGLN